MKSINCKIYDRWGLLISEITKINDGWNGYTTGGLQCKEGVYFYVISGADNNGKVTEGKGFIHLIR